ncbi:hypothetical protein EW146_g5002 [Bondarzewia mesenterica]|uniref:XPG-I domain-containing protein n=1 Tax=Bondarzewia mesenterica TaxID=1095465 RepID=A0A4S4LST1_9AGAM|nr:hypothetical protein EW146_g5002 [Bondarzewia mesenterica]
MPQDCCLHLLRHVIRAAVGASTRSYCYAPVTVTDASSHFIVTFDRRIDLHATSSGFMTISELQYSTCLAQGYSHHGRSRPIVHKAGQSKSLVRLAVDGFESNNSGNRAYRVGIDASIWYTHASFSKGGENPELRLLFFRLLSLAKLPLLPLFVFDGRERPKVKRGSGLGKSGSHNLTAGFKKLLDVFGMEWRMALGEAEAELCHLNRLGVIDAVMTDDVDAVVFGALTIIKNTSLTLTGNKSKPALDSKGNASKHHVWLYTADAIRSHPDIGLTRGGLILIALLSGGDYHSGVARFGPHIAHALARCGYGDQLLTIYERRMVQDIRPSLAQWRNAIHDELLTNSHGFLSRKFPSYTLPPDFPDMLVVANYVSPLTSASDGRQGGGAMRDTGDPSLPRLAAFCETYFAEWGHESAIIKRFRDLLWPTALIRILRRGALDTDDKERTRRINAGRQDLSIRGLVKLGREEAIGTPLILIKRILDTADVDHIRDAFVNRSPQASQRSADKNALKMTIVGSRRHVSTDNILEYRVEFKPSVLISLTRRGIRGKRPERTASSRLSCMTDSPKKPAADPDSAMRLWIPASMIQQVHPGLVEDFERAEVAGKAKSKGKGRAEAVTADNRAYSGDQSFEDSSVPGSTCANVSAIQTVSSSVKSHLGVEEAAASTSSRSWLAHPPTNRHSHFLFTFRDPDDPDMLVREDSLLLPPEAQSSHGPRIPPHRANNVVNHTIPTSSTGPTISCNRQATYLGRETRAPAPRRVSQAGRTIQPVQPDFEVYQGSPDEEHDAITEFPMSTGDAEKEAMHDAIFNSVLGLADGSRPSKVRRAKRSRLGTLNALPTLGEPSYGRQPKKRRNALSSSSFPELQPLASSATAAAPRPKVTVSASTLDSDVIEIFSDPEDRNSGTSISLYPSSSQHHRRYYPPAQPSSSQDSHLFSDVSVFIDLT